MKSVAQNTTERNHTMDTYRDKAHATRSSRRKAGVYAKPTELAIYRKTIARGGDANLTREDCEVLAGCRWLPASQQAKYASLAASVNWG